MEPNLERNKNEAANMVTLEMYKSAVMGLYDAIAAAKKPLRQIKALKIATTDTSKLHILTAAENMIKNRDTTNIMMELTSDGRKEFTNSFGLAGFMSQPGYDANLAINLFNATKVKSTGLAGGYPAPPEIEYSNYFIMASIEVGMRERNKVERESSTYGAIQTSAASSSTRTEGSGADLSALAVAPHPLVASGEVDGEQGRVAVNKRNRSFGIK